MAIRPIIRDDFDAIATLLTEGFPRRSPAYWQAALAALAKRPPVDDLPEFGMLVEIEGEIEGILLTLSFKRGDQRYCNLSSWYVRPDHRRNSIFLMKRVMRSKDTVYLDLSPAPAVKDTIRKLGFQPYSGGTFFLSPFQLFTPGQGQVTALHPGTEVDFDAQGGTVAQHLEQGCCGFLVQDDQGVMPALYRIKWLKNYLPAARFVYGDPIRIMRQAGPLMRALAKRRIPFALIDAPENTSPKAGRLMPDREVRFAHGTPPPVGDLLDSEISVFGP